MNKTKYTVHKVIGTGTVQPLESGGKNAGHYLDYVNAYPALGQLPIGTEVEFVVHVPVERRLVRGKAKWSQSMAEPNRWNLFTFECELAYIHKIHAGEFYWQVHNKCARAETFEAAQQAAEHELADQKKGGFRWEDALQEYECYQVRFYEKVGYHSLGKMYENYEAANKHYYLREDAWILYGFRADGQVDILKRKDGDE